MEWYIYVLLAVAGVLSYLGLGGLFVKGWFYLKEQKLLGDEYDQSLSGTWIILFGWPFLALFFAAVFLIVFAVAVILVGLFLAAVLAAIGLIVAICVIILLGFLAILLVLSPLGGIVLLWSLLWRVIRRQRPFGLVEEQEGGEPEI